MKLEGRILLFDTVNKNRDIFPKDCKITIPEKIPLTWDFHYDQILGIAEVIRDDLGLIAKAEIISNAYIKEEDLKSIFENGKIGAGGFYNRVKKHNDGSFIVVDEATLCSVALVLAPVHEEYYLKIVYESKRQTEKGEARPSVTGDGSYILTDCGNWWFSICKNPMRRNHCICPKCGKIVEVDTRLFNAIEEVKGETE